MLGGGLDGKGVWGRIDLCICMAQLLCCAPQAITTLLINYKKKFIVTVTILSCKKNLGISDATKMYTYMQKSLNILHRMLKIFASLLFFHLT